MAGVVAPPLPPGPFDLLYADPGLFFRGWSRKGEGRSPQRHYRCELVDTVGRLPVASIAAPNSMLCIWAYGPLLPELLAAIIPAWGFTYTGKALCWEKITKDGRPLMDLGLSTRKVTEDAYFAKRGNGLRRCDRGVLELIKAPRREPGRKPDEARRRLERLFGDVRRIELFARGIAPAGWTFWGDQAVPDHGQARDLSTVIAPMEAAK